MVDKNHRDGDPMSLPSSMPSQTPESFMQELTGYPSPLSIILCTDAITKTRLLGMLANLAPGAVFYLDTDLLYAGSTNAGLCRRHDRTTIYCPEQNTWHRDLADVMSAASASKKTTVIIDSLNGVYEIFGRPDSAMSANTHIMALASLAGQADSSVIVGAVVRKRQAHQLADASDAKDTDRVNTTTEEWVLYPSGRQVPRIAKSKTYLLGGTRTSPLLGRITMQ